MPGSRSATSCGKDRPCSRRGGRWYRRAAPRRRATPDPIAPSSDRFRRQEPGRTHQKEKNKQKQRHADGIARRDRRIAEHQSLQQREQKPAEQCTLDSPHAADHQRGKSLHSQWQTHQVGSGSQRALEKTREAGDGAPSRKGERAREAEIDADMPSREPIDGDGLERATPNRAFKEIPRPSEDGGRHADNEKALARGDDRSEL